MEKSLNQTTLSIRIGKVVSEITLKNRKICKFSYLYTLLISPQYVTGFEWHKIFVFEPVKPELIFDFPRKINIFNKM